MGTNQSLDDIAFNSTRLLGNHITLWLASKILQVKASNNQGCIHINRDQCLWHQGLYLHNDKTFYHQGPVLSTWFNFNPNIDK